MVYTGKKKIPQSVPVELIRYNSDEVQRKTIIDYREIRDEIRDGWVNWIMKSLTIIATIFIPLTFFAGIYGMNFKYMPGLGWKWSFPVILVAMLILGVFMYIRMRRKHWL